MKNILYAYMAGFVDADGSISISTVSKNKKFVPKISVHNCKKDIIDLFVSEFGGKVRKRNRKNKNWRPIYEWTLSCKKATYVARKLLPYLFLKKKQAELIIQIYKIREKNKSIVARWHPKEWQRVQNELEEIKVKCVKLNKRGT